MPRMSGPKMVREMRKLDPEVKVIFMTGYSPDRVVPADFQVCRTLFKPFTTAQLYQTVDECLTGRMPPEV